MKNKKIYSMSMLIVVVSFIGFCVENIWMSVRSGMMDNRNMHLPFLIGYGLAVAAIYVLFGTPTKPRLLKYKIDTGRKYLDVCVYFLIAAFCVSIGELVLGNLAEKLFGLEWWNYSSLPLNITKYTSIPTTFGFSILITVFMQFFAEPILNWFEKLNGNVLCVLACVCMTALIIDFVYSMFLMYKTQDFVNIWAIYFR